MEKTETIEVSVNIFLIFLGIFLMLLNLVFYHLFKNVKQCSNDLHTRVSKIPTPRTGNDRKLTLKYFQKKIKTYNNIIVFFSQFYGPAGITSGLVLIITCILNYNKKVDFGYETIIGLFILQIIGLVFAYFYIYKYKIKPCL
ncbi:hypothetical protein [Psychroserpens mesophilus]|uniref:hypothetical protein n=1 Tax=Psychroserpens mesophilus TaxID=325473 RepID=UPI00058AFD14|nr:hypothetical protein [Psychroserpens mesophilus]